MTRATGARPIGGNALTHHPDSAQTLAAMRDLIAEARHRVHLENYIIRDDATGRSFAAALIERAEAGCAVRVLYDALGCRGTGRRFWRGLVAHGVAVRPFRPLLRTSPRNLLSRDHRKLLVVDGETAFVGGLCIGDEWAGDPARGRLPWRDTMVRIAGPAALALDGTFARTWALAGDPLPRGALQSEVTGGGTFAVRVVEGVPGRSRVYRAAQLACAAATERIWIADAYLVMPAALWTSLLDAARDGVDVRVLVPGASDARLVRDLTRVGYRELLEAGVRVFEWAGAMLHAKVMVTDHAWVRVGSSNLNMSSLFANHELDVVVEARSFVEAAASRFRRDLMASTEIVLGPRRYRRHRLASAPPETGPPGGGPHRRSIYERQIVAAVTIRRVAGGLRRTLSLTGAALSAIAGLLMLLFPNVSAVVIAAGLLCAAALLWVDATVRRPDRGPGVGE
jgi:cardiolipin synthase